MSWRTCCRSPSLIVLIEALHRMNEASKYFWRKYAKSSQIWTIMLFYSLLVMAMSTLHLRSPGSMFVRTPPCVQTKRRFNTHVSCYAMFRCSTFREPSLWLSRGWWANCWLPRRWNRRIHRLIILVPTTQYLNRSCLKVLRRFYLTDHHQEVLKFK